MNLLLDLCRRGEWDAATARCRVTPHEAKPIALQLVLNDQFRTVGSGGKISRNPCWEGTRQARVYAKTALGFVVSFHSPGSKAKLDLVAALLSACPQQVASNQLKLGHTPLRDAILNPKCDPAILELMLQADHQFSTEFGVSALTIEDSRGFLPEEHVFMNLSVFCSTISLKKFDSFYKFANNKPKLRNSKTSQYSMSMIKLLSYDSSGFMSKTSTAAGTSGRNEYIYHAVKRLLGIFPDCCFATSPITGCNVLHLVLRNSGASLQTVERVVLAPGASSLLAQRNKCGQTPLHVACSVGVSKSVLKFLLGQAISVRSTWKVVQHLPNELIWCTTNSGHTPVDIELFRLIDGGSMTASIGLPHSQHSTSKRDSALDEILSDFVQSLISARQGADRNKWDISQSRLEQAATLLGDTLERISLIISAAVSDILQGDSRDLLHDMCLLVQPFSPGLPPRIIDLFLWIYEEKVLAKNTRGQTPLHCALQCGSVSFSTNYCHSWSRVVLSLLQLSPECARIKTTTGALPLHLLLNISNVADLKQNEQIETFLILLKALINAFPDGIDTPEPMSELLPFMQASANNWPVEAIYCLLRRSPPCLDRTAQRCLFISETT